MSTLKVDNIRHNSATSDAITMASDGTCTAKLTSVGGAQLSHRNMVVNGGMTVSQRYETSEVQPGNNGFTLDQMRYDLSQSGKFKVQQVTDAPEGFSHSMKVTSLSSYTSGANDYFLLQNFIEGTDTARLEWGTSDAQTVTLSFYVKSSITGVHACGIRNQNYTRGNTQTYTINSANTWERKTVTFTGDTTGTWLTTTNSGLKINFDLGSGSNFQAASTGTWLGTNDFITSNSVKVLATNGATWYITGIQLEVGGTVTSFEHKSYGEEIAKCQRYYYLLYRRGSSSDGNICIGGVGSCYTGTSIYIDLGFPTQMRAAPTLEVPSGSNKFQACVAAACQHFNGIGIVHSQKNCSGIYGTLDSSRTAGQVGNTFFKTADWSEGDRCAFIADMT